MNERNQDDQDVLDLAHRLIEDFTSDREGLGVMTTYDTQNGARILTISVSAQEKKQ